MQPQYLSDPQEDTTQYPVQENQEWASCSETPEVVSARGDETLCQEAKKSSPVPFQAFFVLTFTIIHAWLSQKWWRTKDIRARLRKSADEATEALLELWTEESIEMSLEHSKSSKETRAV